MDLLQNWMSRRRHKEYLTGHNMNREMRVSETLRQSSQEGDFHQQRKHGMSWISHAEATPHRLACTLDLTHSEVPTPLFFFNYKFAPLPAIVIPMLVFLRGKWWRRSKASGFLPFPRIAGEENSSSLSAPRDPNIMPPFAIGVGLNVPGRPASPHQQVA